MAFQFRRDRQNNIALVMAGDIDREITPTIKDQLKIQLDGEVRSLSIDASNVNYLDSSGVSILIIAMQSCRQPHIEFSIDKASDEVMRVLRIAKLDKILSIKSTSGPAQLIDVDVFSDVNDKDANLAQGLDDTDTNVMLDESSDSDLIAALASGDMDNTDHMADLPTTRAEETLVKPAPVQPESKPAPTPAAKEPPAREPGAGGGNSTQIKPGTFN